MTSILWVVLGVTLGAAIGWADGHVARAVGAGKSQIAGEGRVKAAEAGILQELRARLVTVQITLDGRGAGDEWASSQRLREEGEQKVKAQTELENARRAPKILTTARTPEAEGELRVAAETKLRETQTSMDEQKKLWRSQEKP